MPRVRTLLGVGFALACFAGCASGPSPPIHHYRLEADPPTALAAPIFEGTLQVDRTRTDAFTGQRSLVHRRVDAAGEATHLHRYAQHRWVDPPSRMIEHEIVRYLRAAGAADMVVTSELRVRPSFVLHTRLLHLEQTRDPAGIVLALDMVLTRNDDEVVLQESYRIETTLEDESVPEAVAAYNAAFTQILAQLLDQAARMR
jgi:cholesterol transport system auxiliary component